MILRNKLPITLAIVAVILAFVALRSWAAAGEPGLQPEDSISYQSQYSPAESALWVDYGRSWTAHIRTSRKLTYILAYRDQTGSHEILRLPEPTRLQSDRVDLQIGLSGESDISSVAHLRMALVAKRVGEDSMTSSAQTVFNRLRGNFGTQELGGAGARGYPFLAPVSLVKVSHAGKSVALELQYEAAP